MPGDVLPGVLQSILRDPNSPAGFYLLPFQILTLARHASVSLHIFISQLAPPANKTPPGEALPQQTMKRLGQMTQLSRAADGEATRLMQMGFAPFRRDGEAASSLRKGMREGLVLSSVRGSPGVQQAVQRVVGRREEEKKDE